MDKHRARLVKEVPYGTYVWEMPDGRWVGDDQGNFMTIFAIEGDREKIQELTNAARSYGITTGGPVFLSGQRPIDDEEYEHQKQRMAWGLIPDPMDVPAHAEEAKNARSRR